MTRRRFSALTAVCAGNTLVFLMLSLGRLIGASSVLILVGCGSVTERPDGAATGGTPGTDAGAGGSGGQGGAPSGSAGSTGSGGGAGAAGAAGAGACSVQLLKNGDFEAGNVSWTATPTDRRLIYLFGEIDPTIVPPMESDYIAWLGYKVVSQTVTLEQQIQVPANALSVTVSGSVYIQTDEDSTPYDFGYVETVANGMTDPEMSWSNANAGDTWVPFSVTRTPTWLPGQTATFRLRVVMDDGTNTSFFFDNLSFVANLCP